MAQSYAMSIMIMCGACEHRALRLNTGEGNIVTPLDLLMATVWHVQHDDASASLLLSFSGSSIMLGHSFLPSQSPPMRQVDPDFATPPMSQPRAASPFEGNIPGSRAGSNVGHSFMGLSRKVSVYDSSGAHVMACDCESAFQCAGYFIWLGMNSAAI